MTIEVGPGTFVDEARQCSALERHDPIKRDKRQCPRFALVGGDMCPMHDSLRARGLSGAPTANLFA